MNTSEEIEKSFGDGPLHRPVEERIAAGRRLVVRRRIAVGAGAAGTILLIGGTAWGLAPGSTPSTGPEPSQTATQPTNKSPGQGTGNEADRKHKDPQSYLTGGELATYTPDGKVVVRKGWRISQRIPNPYGLQPPAKSVGLELTKGSETYWYILEIEGNGMSSASDPAGNGFATLEAWVASQVALQEGSAPPSPVELRPGTAELVAVDGATIVRQRPDPEVPGFAGPGDNTAVAEVRWNGARYFVLARQIAGSDPEYFPTSASVPAKPTLESFLDHARKQYGSGEGLR